MKEERAVGAAASNLLQDLQQLLSDLQGWQAPVWEGREPFLDGRHHAAVNKCFFEVLPAIM